MSDARTLNEFFHLDDPTRARAAARALQRSPELREAQVLPAPLRGPAAEAIVFTAKALLTDPVSGIIGSAWGKLRDLHRFVNAPPGEINEFSLHDHEIALSRTPSIDLVLNGAPTGIQLRFELKVGLSISGAALRIQDARIVGASIGKVRGMGAFNLGRASLVERKTEVFRLPANLTFTPGVALT